MRENSHVNMPFFSDINLLKVHSQELLRISMISSPSVTIFITLGQGVHENRQIYMDHCKLEILGETPLNMTIDRFSLSDGIFTMYYISILAIRTQNRSKSTLQCR